MHRQMKVTHTEMSLLEKFEAPVEDEMTPPVLLVIAAIAVVFLVVVVAAVAFAVIRSRNSKQ